MGMKNMLQISEGSSLAMHAMAFLASHSGQPWSAKDIASALGGSVHHLSKVLQRLVKSGLVESTRGPKGGFLLASGAEESSLLNVYEAIEGKFRESDCLLSEKICRGDRCVFGEVLEKTNRMVYDHLNSTRISELVGIL